MANTAAVRYLQTWGAAALPLTEPKFHGLEVPALKTLFQQGLSRGAITEVNGGGSSGRTSVCLHMLAQATRRGEICAVVDLDDRLHPASAAASGVRLERLLWVRCHGNAEHALRVADLLLHAGGFGVVLLDICDASPRVLNRIPLSYWYRFHRAIEHTPTILIVCGAATPQVRSSSLQRVQLARKRARWIGRAPFLILQGVESDASLTKASVNRLERLWMETVA